jgi:hypothetical protein
MDYSGARPALKRRASLCQGLRPVTGQRVRALQASWDIYELARR